MEDDVDDKVKVAAKEIGRVTLPSLMMNDQTGLGKTVEYF